MRVLHVPVNVASHMSVTVRGLRAVGVDAYGVVVYGVSPVRDDAEIALISRSTSRRSPRWAVDALMHLPQLLRAIRSADVLHWYMTPGLPGALDLHYAARLGKPQIVEFAGGDVRRPSLEAAENPYYAAARPRYEYRKWETDANSLRTQRLFSGAGVEALVSCWSLLDYLDHKRWRKVHIVRQRVMTSDFTPAYPDPVKPKPLIVHAATGPVAKGTAAVHAAVEQLRDRVDFDFIALDRAPRVEALATIARADVYLDQFVLGAHGSAAIEAMALGKPVVAWVKPSMVARYPGDIPIVNATQEELPGALENLVRNGPLRHELGVRSRAYAEREHDAVALADQLRAIYEAVARRSPRRSSAAT
jgi:hypothetical protein